MTTCMLMLCYFGDLPSFPPMVVALCVMYVIADTLRQHWNFNSVGSKKSPDGVVLPFMTMRESVFTNSTANSEVNYYSEDLQHTTYSRFLILPFKKFPGWPKSVRVSDSPYVMSTCSKVMIT